MNPVLEKIYEQRREPYFFFLIIFLLSGIICLGALRHNNLTMVKLRENVYQADRTNGDISGALDKLRSYVYGHMNTDLSSGSNGIKPPIQLSYTYARLEQAQQQNSNLYIEAKNYCEQQIPASVSISGRGRISCITDYVTSHGVKPAEIPVGLYEYDFLSPRWSPDLAGWSLVAAILSFIGFIVTLALAKLTNIKLPHVY